MGYEVWAITRANNRRAIEHALASQPIPNLHFVYYDLPEKMRFWKKGRRGIYLYYLLWQWGIYRRAKQIVSRQRFDWVHHVTFASIRQPSFLGRLRRPFIFGPVAGGERAPFRLRRSYPWRGWWKDLLRDIGNMVVRIDPLLCSTFRHARIIFATSTETRALVPARYRHKARVRLAIGSDMRTAVAPTRERGRPPRILFVGELLYLKGLHLGLRAFEGLLKSVPSARMTVIGSGPDEAWLRRKAESLGIAHAIDWRSWLPRPEVLDAYSEHDLFLFPSLHDSGGMAVLEALSFGVPVVCVGIGGPATIVNHECGRVVEVAGRTEGEVVDGLRGAIEELLTDAAAMQSCSRGACDRAEQLAWSRSIPDLVRAIESSVREEEDAA